eukprot:GHVT01095087.1.p4 GENE.GHVT01095087.1~~GHVT01095087.1.p4  ORF type:complete len:154 (-),score=23.50 GHVT01095087.1:988-1449(-)
MAGVPSSSGPPLEQQASLWLADGTVSSASSRNVPQLSACWVPAGVGAVQRATGAHNTTATLHRRRAPTQADKAATGCAPAKCHFTVLRRPAALRIAHRAAEPRCASNSRTVSPLHRSPEPQQRGRHLLPKVSTADRRHSHTFSAFAPLSRSLE